MILGILSNSFLSMTLFHRICRPPRALAALASTLVPAAVRAAPLPRGPHLRPPPLRMLRMASATRTPPPTAPLVGRRRAVRRASPPHVPAATPPPARPQPLLTVKSTHPSPRTHTCATAAANMCRSTPTPRLWGKAAPPHSPSPPPLLTPNTRHLRTCDSSSPKMMKTTANVAKTATAKKMCPLHGHQQLPQRDRGRKAFLEQRMRTRTRRPHRRPPPPSLLAAPSAKGMKKPMSCGRLTRRQPLQRKFTRSGSEAARRPAPPRPRSAAPPPQRTATQRLP